MVKDSVAPLSMQEVILCLQSFWSDQGCIIGQPANTEVGAGTANPLTSLRVLGPHPWSVAYVEPSVRPDDSRYGENPNRLQTHTQFQVILKPGPHNPQELYLASLAAIGIDLVAHDIRFVEDNWASPALGAWGLGWEVWLDGMEITQFTYFQQLGGITLDPVSVEITYGLERILMKVQQVSNFKDIRYSDTVTYGDIFSQSEFEMSTYYLDAADIDFQRRLLDDYAREAERLIEAKLPIPAYGYVLRCSHAFNVLDSRGAVSTTDRAGAFTKMRDLTRKVAHLWVEKLDEYQSKTPLDDTSISEVQPLALTLQEETVDHAQPFLCEIGVEELPSHEVYAAIDQVRFAITEALAQTRLSYGPIYVSATPRRIVLTIESVSSWETPSTHIVKGPKVAMAYDKSGAPTKALQGFLHKNSVSLTDVKIHKSDAGDYTYVEKLIPARSSSEVLTEIIAAIVFNLRAERNIRWNDPILSYSRPIRWIMAILGSTPLAIKVSELISDNTTRVQRKAPHPVIEICSATNYLQLLEKHNIILDLEQRQEKIRKDAHELAASVGGVIDEHAHSDLIDEITNLVEYPTAIMGSFDPHYLEMPEAIVTTVMRVHQRYIPIIIGDVLSHYFIAIANGDCDHDIVRKGNESVLTARYEDALFFWRSDINTPIDHFHAQLETLLFDEKIGSMAERSARINAIAVRLAASLGDKHIATIVGRAGSLAKFDLSTQVVIELSELAGIIAKEYALIAGESPEVAQALADMEMPRNFDDPLPQTLSGALLALADRFDYLLAMISVGASLTGSSDRFGLRRAANGIISIYRAFPQLAHMRVSDIAAIAREELEKQGHSVSDTAYQGTVTLLVKRYEKQLHDQGHDAQYIRAIELYAEQPAIADKYLSEIIQLAQDRAWLDLVTAIGRCIRIIPQDKNISTVNEDALALECEKELLAQVNLLNDFNGSLLQFLEVSKKLPVAVNTFFEQALVFDPDPQIQSARLSILQRLKDNVSRILYWHELA